MYKYRDTQPISEDPITRTGSIVSIDNPDDVLALHSIKANIEPIQNGEPWISALNTEPYQFRQVPTQSHEFGYEIDKLVGGTVAWNQLIPEAWRTTNAGTLPFDSGTSITQGHKYLIWGNRTDNSKQSFMYVYTRKDNANLSLVLNNAPANGGLSVGTIFSASASGISDGTTTQSEGNIWLYQGIGDSFVKFSNALLFDLTQMFGTTIADYIYSLETANAGAGVAWFKKLFNKPYYAYNAGELKSVSGLVSHDMTGFNQWDEEWEVGGISDQTGGNITNNSVIRAKNHIRVLPRTAYYLKAPDILGMRYYDADKNFIRGEAVNPNQTWNMPSDTHYIRFVLINHTTYNNDVCINISWDGSRDGEYEPYDKHSYPLDSDLTLRGIPKLDANNNLYYDGDVYEADGTVTRKYGIVDLASLNWTYADSRFYASLAQAVTTESKPQPSAICSKYRTSNAYAGGDKTIFVSVSHFVSVWDSAYTDPATFKTAMSGVMFVYELATPTTETADPYTNPQVVDDFGTEEYVSTSIVPIGHSTSYANICPISGYDEVNVYVSPTTSESDATVYTTDLNGTVYGGMLDVVSGVLTVTDENIASYNGETLPSTWISDRDVYASGTTPTIGAQVVYKLATPTTVQLTAQEVELLAGTNNIWADSGDVSVTYAVDLDRYVIKPAEAVSINGKYLEDIVKGYRTLYVKGRESLAVDLDTYSVGTSNGEKIKGSKYPARTLTIGFQLLCDTNEEFRQRFNQLNNILSIGEADFVFNDEKDKFFTGFPIMDADIETGRNNVVGEWTLYCAYPFKRSVQPITLTSTDAVIEGNTATFTFDYDGVMPAKPVLRAEFASAKVGGDYSEDGDCGYVAFLNQDESIIQLGNPDVMDVDADNKNDTLINTAFDALTNWTASGISLANITDPYWNKGAGQTMKFARGTGTLTRSIANTINFEFDVVQRLCVNSPTQTGTFKALLKNGNRIIVGYIIEKTGSGTTANVKYILNDIVVGADTIDVSYYNTNFGYCNRTPVYVTQDTYTLVREFIHDLKRHRTIGVFRPVKTGTRQVQDGWNYTQSNLNSGISRSGSVVTFSVGNLPDRTFKSSDIEATPCSNVTFETTGTFNTNAIRSACLVKKAGVPFADIPNVFTAGDIVEADCNSADVFLYRAGSVDGHLEPQYGALGNDWETFEIKVGQNIIRAVWSEWVNTNYKPVVKIIFNKVYI